MLKRFAFPAAVVALILVASGCIFDGTHTVGAGQGQVLPGLYWSGGGDGCYFARLSNTSGESGGIIANEFNPRQGVQIVQISETDAAFETSRCAPWVELGSDPLVQDSTAPQTSDRTSRVNIEIAPGQWEADPAGSCYWERTTGLGHTSDQIIANDFSPSGHQVVRIAPTDVGFTSSACGTWTRTAL